MEDFTKKGLNRIKAAAFEEFKKNYSDEEFKRIFYGKDIITAWRITEGTQIKMTLTQYDTQINGNTLGEMGFTGDAKVEKIFCANRQTKTIEFVGRV